MYVSKIEEIRAIAGPIVQRYNDKVEEERQAALKIQEENEKAKRAEEEAKRKAEEEAKKDQEEVKSNDVDMKDSETVQPNEIEEAENSGK